MQRVASGGADAPACRSARRVARSLSLTGTGQLALHSVTREHGAFGVRRKCGAKRQGDFAGARLPPPGEDGFFRLRFPGQFAFANRKAADDERLGAGVELPESGVRIRHCVENAAEAAAGTAGGADQLLRARVAGLLFLSGVHFVDAARGLSALDEFVLPGMRLLRVSFAAGVPGGSY